MFKWFWTIFSLGAPDFYHRCLCFIFYQTTMAQEQSLYDLVIGIRKLSESGSD